MKNLFKMITVIFTALLVLSTSAIAGTYKPSVTAESEFYPAANVCGYNHNQRDGSFMTRYNAGLQLSGLGDMMVCSLPIKADKYIERVVMDVYINGVSPRICQLSSTSGSSGASGINSPIVTMNYVSDGNVKVWQTDDFGAVPAYNGGNPQNSLFLRCQHWNMTGNQFVRYGTIRVDYSPTGN